jgi:hypothetical protein
LSSIDPGRWRRRRLSRREVPKCQTRLSGRVGGDCRRPGESPPALPLRRGGPGGSPPSKGRVGGGRTSGSPVSPLAAGDDSDPGESPPDTNWRRVGRGERLEVLRANLCKMGLFAFAETPRNGAASRGSHRGARRQVHGLDQGSASPTARTCRSRRRSARLRPAFERAGRSQTQTSMHPK